MKDASTNSTLLSFSAKYIKFLRATRSKSYCRDNEAAFEWISGKFGDVALDTIKVADLEQVFAVEFARARHHAARMYRTLKAGFSKAVAWGELRSNPFQQFKLPRIPERSTPYLRADDLDKLLPHIGAKDLRLLIRFAFYTGMRQGELLNLTWGSVDFTQRTIRVSNSDDFTTKSKRERILPANSTLMEILDQIKMNSANVSATGHVFQRNGKKINGNYLSRQFKKGVRLAALDERLHFHSLRHSFASNLIAAGVNPIHVQKLLGHSNLSTTLRYTHVQLDDLRDAVGRLD